MQHQPNHDDNYTTKRPRLAYGGRPPSTKRPRSDYEQHTNKEAKIGEGTYGVVYKARDKKTREIVAVKKLKTEMVADCKIRPPETEILTSLNHPSIIDHNHVVIGSHAGALFMVMEYVENDLNSLLAAKKQPFTLSQIKCLMQQLLQGVAYLHRNQVIQPRSQNFKFAS